MNVVQQLASLLREQNLTISVAESCSGGLVAKMLTDLPGSSSCFLAGVVAYSNNAKLNFLAVPPSLIERYGAVSAEVAAAMAEGMRRASGSDISLSITGIAGPDGGTHDKPVGTVFIGHADADGCSTMLSHFSGTRGQIRSASSLTAIEWAVSLLNHPESKR